MDQQLQKRLEHQVKLSSWDQRQQEELTEKAVIVIRRVRDKLSGLDFNDQQQWPNQDPGLEVAALHVPDQVDRLIRQAKAPENLCQSYIGWCPFW